MFEDMMYITDQAKEGDDTKPVKLVLLETPLQCCTRYQ